MFLDFKAVFKEINFKNRQKDNRDDSKIFLESAANGIWYFDFPVVSGGKGGIYSTGNHEEITRKGKN